MTRTKLRFLGAGGAFSQRYGTTCSLITLPSGEHWLLDCGRQAPDQLREAGITWHDISGQLVTHTHGDHVFGMEEFALRRFYESRNSVAAISHSGPRPRLVAHSAVRAELWEVLGPSLRYLPQDGRAHSGTLSHYFDVMEATRTEPPNNHAWPRAESFDLSGWSVTTRETVHVRGKPTCALEISTGDTGHSAWWSGDSTVDAKRLLMLEPNVSIFFHDCTFVETEGQVHGAFADLLALPQSLREKIVLMHHEDDVEQRWVQISEAGFRLALPGHVYDLNTGEQIEASTR
ncbi:MAG: MBL fold metallo-hydrolase [Nannocystaceae bacterium]